MNLKARKLDIIDEILHLEDENTILMLEDALKNKKKSKKHLTNYTDILSSKEAEKMKKAIKEGCEVIKTDEWK
ncbi:MAG: hypothetical protein IT275_06150 [Chitinophagales bacterium]|nr:hypothetical protein [Chitinophagales bacterium]